jgi:uncharacterized protein involved in exopolysaccharide biosynthesis
MENQNKENILEEDELDLIELYKNILAGKFYIFFITLAFGVGSIAYSLSMPNLYTASSLLNAVEKSGQTPANSKGSIGSILSLAGGASGAGNRANLAIAIIHSREFFEHLISIEGILPKLVSSNSYDKETGELMYNKNLFDKETDKWNLSITEAYSEVYRKDLVVNLNTKTGFIYLSYDHISPEFAYEFISLIIDEVNSLARQKDIQEAADAMVYLEKEMEDYTQVGIQASIGQLIESQLKTKMLANVRENYLLDPIDSPMLPDMKSKPYRAKIVIIGTLIGFVLSLLITIIMSYGFGKRDRK